MKKSFFITVFLITVAATSLFADEIHLKSGQIIKGNVLNVTANAVEYKPESAIPFDLIPRDQVAKIKYKNGKTIIFSNTASRDTAAEERDAVQPKEKAIIKTESQPEPGANTHDGFYFRFMYGGGSLKTKVQTSGVPDLEISGPAYNLNLQFGYAIVDNFILFVEEGVMLLSKKNAKIKTNGQLPNNDGIEVQVGYLGLGLTWYFMPENFYISGSIGSTYTKLSGNPAYYDGATDKGTGGFFSIGKEWWVSDNWGLGVAFIGFHGKSTATAKGVYGQSLKSTVTNDYFGIVFTATYN